MAVNDQVAIRNIGLSEDLLRDAKSDLPFAALLEAQSRIVDLMASDRDLHETLDGITRLVEDLAPPALCTILLMDPDGRHLRVGAANSMPDAYNELCRNGIPVGDFQGSCGTAAYRRQAVIVDDIEADPLWDVPPRPLVIATGLRACWSMPILDDAGAVLGTVAMYYKERRKPTGRDWGLLEPAARLIRLALAQQRNKARIRHLADHDALTDLPNRVLLTRRLADGLDDACKAGTKVSLLYLDLDYFKPVNDRLGHAAGDELLIQVARRLSAELRAGDMVARIGGDEFVVVTSCDQPGYAAAMARRIIAALSQPFEILCNRVEIGTSIGVAVYPKDGDSQQALLHAADTALYCAKQHRRGTVRFFEPAMDEHLQARQRLERDLRRAIERNQMQLYYQPVVSCASGDLVGFEALLRWHHPELGVVPPFEFIPLAEKIGLIASIGQWVIDTACEAAAGWKQPHWVSVNVSPVQFRVSDLRRVVCDALDRTGLPAGRLELEITEGTLIEDARHADIISPLRRQGVRFALDDFGTGYSGLGYLQKSRIDKLKIDRSFIARLGEADDATVMVRSIVGLAHNLGLSVTAEGVETPEQLALVREFMCEEAQGFLLGRPLPVGAPFELPAARVRHDLGRVQGVARRSLTAAPRS